MISLREFSEKDIERLAQIANNAEVAKYLTSKFPNPYTLKDAKFWINEGSKEGIVRAIEFNGKLIGSVAVHPQKDEYAQRAIVGYWIGRDYWGQSIATIALRILVDEVFKSTDITRLQASVFSPNTASMKVLNKAGFSEEGVLRKAVFKNGELYDEHIFDLLNSNL